MKAAIAQGPVSGPALAVPGGSEPFLRRARRNCPTEVSDKPTPRIRGRRQIGLGARAIIVTEPACTSTARRHAQPMKRRRVMKRTTLYAILVGALLVSAAALGISAAVDSPRSLMSPIDFGEAKKTIEADARLALGTCRDLDGQAKDLCRAQARAEERVRKAD